MESKQKTNTIIRKRVMSHLRRFSSDIAQSPIPQLKVLQLKLLVVHVVNPFMIWRPDTVLRFEIDSLFK